MKNLIKFELRKILTKRFAVISVAAVLLLSLILSFSTLHSMYAFDGNGAEITADCILFAETDGAVIKNVNIVIFLLLKFIIHISHLLIFNLFSFWDFLEIIYFFDTKILVFKFNL